MLVFGHRGDSENAPENTLSALIRCLENSAISGAELDVWQVKSGEFVVIHNEDLARTTTGNGLISNKSHKEIQSFECRFKNAISQEHPPLLKDVFKLGEEYLLGERKFVLNIELKVNPETDSSIGYSLAKWLRDHTRESPFSIVISCFDHNHLVAIKKLAPHVQTALLMGGLLGFQDLIDYTLTHKFDWWNLQHLNISHKTVAAARKAKVKIAAWAPDNPKEWDRLKDCDVDAIITNRPYALVKYLAR